MATKKPPPLRTFPITRFTGIETKYSPIDQKRGTLKVADGVNVVPLGALSFGPNWKTAWGLSDIAASITTALAGADSSKVHFVTVANDSSTFLIAWDLANARPQGIWQIAGNTNPFIVEDATVTVRATSSNHTEEITFTGTGTARTVVLSIGDGLPGDRILVSCSFSSTAGIVVTFTNDEADGTVLSTYTTTGTTYTGAFEFVLNAAGNWEYLTFKAPS